MRTGKHYREGHSFVARNCWLCGNELKTREEVDFVIPGDCRGVCKDHHLKDILSVNTRYNYSNSVMKHYQNKGLQNIVMGCNVSLKKKIKIIIKNKTPNKMRKLLINLFIFVLGFEILIHLPHIINVLINKIK